MDQATLAVLREFAHGLVKPGRETRLVVLKEAVPQLGLVPGDMVVYAAGLPATGGRWLVLKTVGADGSTHFTVDRARLARQVCGCVLFTIHSAPDRGGSNGR